MQETPRNVPPPLFEATLVFGPGSEATLRRYPVGGLSEYVLSPDMNIARIPDSIDLNTAARLGYIGTSFAGLKKAGMGPGRTLLINGVTGTLGYAAVAIALGLGCTKILGVGRNPEKLEHVAGLGVNDGVVVCSSEAENDLGEWVKKNTDGLGPDALYDCLGNGGEGTMELIRTVKTGGKAILAAGGATSKPHQDYSEAMMRNVTIVGTQWFTHFEIDDLIALIDAKVVDLSFLEDKVFSLEQANEALQFVGDRPGGNVHVMVLPGKHEGK